MIASIVDTSALWQTIVAALVAGVGTTLIFSLAILGAVRFADANRHGHGLQAALFGGLAVLGLIATGVAVVVAVVVMTRK